MSLFKPVWRKKWGAQKNHLETEYWRLRRAGLFFGGGFELLGRQLLAALILALWSSCLSAAFLLVPNRLSLRLRLRLSLRLLTHFTSLYLQLLAIPAAASEPHRSPNDAGGRGAGRGRTRTRPRCSRRQQTVS